ncbi:MAG: sugar phosphate isomerase/epimerase [Armatimonadetes bacterium]|nr:sugar phosphate isomerase/epimerase [Armatimonadota bacterium]
MLIGIAGWAINRRFRSEDNPLPLLDFPRVAKEEFGLSHIEINNVFMASHDDSYLDELVAAAREAGVTMWGMAVDGTGNLAATDEEERKQAVAAAMEYFDIAGKLGLKYFRVNTGGSPEAPPDEMEACIRSFRELAEEGERCGIKIATENHGGLSMRPRNMVRIIEGVGLDSMASLPDFGNFDDVFRYSGIAWIMPYAVGVHAKWNKRDGGRVDIARMVGIARNAGYDGPIFIEDGGPVDDHRGVLELKGALMAAIPEYQDE